MDSVSKLGERLGGRLQDSIIAAVVRLQQQHGYRAGAFAGVFGTWSAAVQLFVLTRDEGEVTADEFAADARRFFEASIADGTIALYLDRARQNQRDMRAAGAKTQEEYVDACDCAECKAKAARRMSVH